MEITKLYPIYLILSVIELDLLFSFDLRTFYVKSHYLISLLMTAGAGWLPLNHSCVAAMIGIMQLIICVETAGG